MRWNMGSTRAETRLVAVKMDYEDDGYVFLSSKHTFLFSRICNSSQMSWQPNIPNFSEAN